MTMTKLYVYSNQNDNNSLGNIAHLLINSGLYNFTVNITRLVFDITPENVSDLDDKIREVLGNEIYFVTVD